MRRTHTLIVTLFVPELDSGELRGRVRHVADGREATFVRLEELVQLLREAAFSLPPANPNRLTDAGEKLP